MIQKQPLIVRHKLASVLMSCYEFWIIHGIYCITLQSN
jgi:hypothetical protein